MRNLTDLQRDAISELMNIGMGRAANALSQMAHDEVRLSVPFVDVLSIHDVIQRLQAQALDAIAVVKQQFAGVFWGEALLLFPEAQSLELVRILLQDMVPLERMADMEQEAFMEIGNIILNACLGSLANLLSSEISSSLPTLMQGTCTEIFTMLQNKYLDDDYVLFLKIDFALPTRALNGYVAFVIDGASTRALQDSVEHLLSALQAWEQECT